MCMYFHGDFARLCQQFFRAFLPSERGLSLRTKAVYLDSFRLMLIYAATKATPPIRPREFTMEHFDVGFVRGFLNWLEEGRNNSPRTRNVRIAAIHAFCRFALMEAPEFSARLTQVLAIQTKRFERRIVPYLTHDQIQMVLDSVDQRTWAGQRNHTMILTAAQTGHRVSELTGLRRMDVMLDHNPSVRCEGKGRKERVLPLAKIVVARLRKWLKEVSGCPLDYIFPGKDGKRLSPDAFQHALKVAQRRCPQLGDIRLSPHVLRHSAAMALLEAGMDPRELALWLGHEDVRSTQVYIHTSAEIKRKALEKLEPLRCKRRRSILGDDEFLKWLEGL